MPQFNAYPAMQARTFDLQGIQRQSLENQLLQSKLQQAQNPQPDPTVQLAREKFEFSQDKDQRAQSLQHTKVLGQYAGASAQASGVQRVMIHGEAVKYAQANGIPTDGWLDPSDPNYVAWAQAQQARAGEAEKQAGGLLSPEVEAQKIRISQARGPLVQMGTEETARSKAVGKTLGEFEAETYTTIQKSGRATRGEDARLSRMDQLLDQTYTGTGAEFLTKARKLDKALGWNIIGGQEDIAPAEAAMALSNEMALQLRNPAGGAGMPGQLSDKDREFLVTMVPGLGQTRGGRKLLIRARKKMNKRTREVAKRARQYYAEHGTLGVGFENELADWSDKNPVFSKEDITAREAARLPHPRDAAEMRALDSGTYFVDPEDEIRIAP